MLKAGHKNPPRDPTHRILELFIILPGVRFHPPFLLWNRPRGESVGGISPPSHQPPIPADPHIPHFTGPLPVLTHGASPLDCPDLVPPQGSHKGRAVQKPSVIPPTEI